MPDVTHNYFHGILLFCHVGACLALFLHSFCLFAKRVGLPCIPLEIECLAGGTNQQGILIKLGMQATNRQPPTNIRPYSECPQRDGISNFKLVQSFFLNSRLKQHLQTTSNNLGILGIVVSHQSGTGLKVATQTPS